MTIATLAMESIDEPRLESDTDYRVGYLTKFMGFGPDDVQAIHDSAAHLAPLVPSLVDAVYLKLFAFDATKRHFLSRNAGYSGALPFPGRSRVMALLYFLRTRVRGSCLALTRSPFHLAVCFSPRRRYPWWGKTRSRRRVWKGPPFRRNTEGHPPAV